MSALADSLEKKEAQLNEVLSASNLDPTALTVVTRKLEDVLDSKNSAIKVCIMCTETQDSDSHSRLKIKELTKAEEKLGRFLEAFR